jgi:hypothetical protein
MDKRGMLKREYGRRMFGKMAKRKTKTAEMNKGE